MIRWILSRGGSFTNLLFTSLKNSHEKLFNNLLLLLYRDLAEP